MQGGAGVLVGEANRAYLKEGQHQWHHWNGAGWIGHPSDPAHNRSCVDDQTWKWSMVNNDMEIDLKKPRRRWREPLSKHISKLGEQILLRDKKKSILD